MKRGEGHFFTTGDAIRTRAASLGEEWTEPIDSGKLASTNPARHGPEQGTFEVIPCDRIQGGRDQFLGFRHTTPVLSLAPLGFLNIIDR
jgi:hypothetical protein